MIDTKQFILAGNATFTVTSKRTGARFTFKVQKSKDGGRHYAKLLTGPDNENNFQYFGTIFNASNFRHGNPDKTVITQNAPSAQAFAWLWQHLDNAPVKINGQVVDRPLDLVEVHHEGKCCRCGRKLTVPRSVELGYGEECASLMGMAF